MGVKDLWSVLSRVREECALSELSGKTLAVDLSGWICQALTTKGLSTAVSKPHLRNLFYRVRSLLRVGAGLVFVVDGAVSQLKSATMECRGTQRARLQGGSYISGSSGTRPWLDSYVAECCALLDALGVPHLQSRGEAEAYCALLNSSGAVHGVLTQDSDAFLYGATVVYRDLSTDQKEQHVSCYRMSRVRAELGLSRSSLVALALLLGCDYCPGGVPGVGRQSALSLLHSCLELDPECDLLQRMRSWRDGKESPRPPEQRIQRKALQVKGFPDENVISEYLEPKDKIPKEHSALHWRRPDLPQLELFCLQNLNWSRSITDERSECLLTQWTLRAANDSTQEGVTPLRILKQRMKYKVLLYEVQWRRSGSVMGVALDKSARREVEFVTTENGQQVENTYPDLVMSYRQQQREDRIKKEEERKLRKRKSSKSCEKNLNPTSLGFRVKKMRHNEDSGFTITDKMEGQISEDARQCCTNPTQQTWTHCTVPPPCIDLTAESEQEDDCILLN